MHFLEEAWVPGGDRHQLSLTTSEASGDWARGPPPALDVYLDRWPHAAALSPAARAAWDPDAPPATALARGAPAAAALAAERAALRALPPLLLLAAADLLLRALVPGFARARAQLVPRTATSKICGNKWPVRNLLKDLSRSHLCFENSFDLSYKICHL